MAASSKTVHIFSRISGILQEIQRRCTDLKLVNVEVPAKADDKQLSRDSYSALQEAVVLVGDPGLVADYGLAQDLTSLKWMQSTWAGVDSLIKSLDKTKPHPEYQLTRFSGCFGPHMAEYVIAQIIARERNFDSMRKCQLEKKWDQDGHKEYRLLSQLTLGIIGVGDIGKHIAKTAKHFNMRVAGVVRRELSASERCSHVDTYLPMSSLPELLSMSDYIVSALPSTPGTVGLLSGDIFKSCQQKKSVFINIGRGDVVDEESILRALDNCWLGGAVLDVFCDEPLPSSSPLWSHPLVTITPHVSAVSFGSEVAEVFADNYKRYQSGEKLKYRVDFTEGY